MKPEGADTPAPRLSREEFFKGGGERTERIYEVEVWRCNARVVDIYQTCMLDRAGISGAAAGLSAQEIHTALLLHRVPERRWPALTRDLLWMARAACEYLHDQDKREADKRAAEARKAGKVR